MLITNVARFSDCVSGLHPPRQTCFKMCWGGCVAALSKLESRFERLCRSNSTTKTHRLRGNTLKHAQTPSGLTRCRALNLAASSRNAHFPRSLSVRAKQEDIDQSETPVKTLKGTLYKHVPHNWRRKHAGCLYEFIYLLLLIRKSCEWGRPGSSPGWFIPPFSTPLTFHHLSYQIKAKKPTPNPKKRSCEWICPLCVCDSASCLCFAPLACSMCLWLSKDVMNRDSALLFGLGVLFSSWESH